MVGDKQEPQEAAIENGAQFGVPYVIEVLAKAGPVPERESGSQIWWESQVRVVQGQGRLQIEAERRVSIAMGRRPLHAKAVTRMEVILSEETQVDLKAVARWVSPPMSLSAHMVASLVHAMTGFPLVTPPNVKTEDIQFIDS